MNSSIASWFSDFVHTDYLWVVEVFFVVFFTTFLSFICSRFLGKLRKRARGTKNVWDDALFESIYAPSRYIIWLVGFSYAAEIAGSQAQVSIFDAIPAIRRVGTIAIFSWFLVNMIGRAERNLMNPDYARDPLDPTTASAVGKLLRVSVVITAALVALQSMGYSISGVLAFGGIGGIAVGFAAKDLLANFFGGLMIYLDRPFKVGDWIRSPDKEIEGTVEHIGWRQTCIRTFDKRPLYVPNATFTQISVENPSRMTNRRIYETIGLRYDDIAKMSVIVADVDKMLKNHEAIDQTQTIIVNFNTFASSSVDFFVYTYTKTKNWIEFHKIKQDVLLKIVDIVEQHGAEMAFPTSTIHVPNHLEILDKSDAPHTSDETSPNGDH